MRGVARGEPCERTSRQRSLPSRGKDIRCRAGMSVRGPASGGRGRRPRPVPHPGGDGARADRAGAAGAVRAARSDAPRQERARHVGDLRAPDQGRRTEVDARARAPARADPGGPRIARGERADGRARQDARLRARPVLRTTPGLRTGRHHGRLARGGAAVQEIGRRDRRGAPRRFEDLPGRSPGAHRPVAPRLLRRLPARGATHRLGLPRRAHVPSAPPETGRLEPARSPARRRRSPGRARRGLLQDACRPALLPEPPRAAGSPRLPARS